MMIFFLALVAGLWSLMNPLEAMVFVPFVDEKMSTFI
jgi:hypothetical protein